MKGALKEKNFVSAVIYIHNVEKSIESFLSNLYSVLETNFEKFEIICVDDKSDDKSREIIRSFVMGIKKATVVSLIEMSFYQGKEASISAGVDLAIGDYVFEIERCNDFQNQNKLIMATYERAMEGFDIVSSIPKGEIGVSSKIFYKIFNFFWHGEYKIRHETLRIVSRRAINRMDSLSKTSPYRKALYASCGLAVSEISETESHVRNNNYAEHENKNRVNTAIDALILFTNAVTKISLAISLCFLVTSVGIGAYTAWVYWFGKKPIEGWTPIMLFLAVGFLGIFFLTTIVLKYLSILVGLVFKKQNYLIQSIEKLN